MIQVPAGNALIVFFLAILTNLIHSDFANHGHKFGNKSILNQYNLLIDSKLVVLSVHNIKVYLFTQVNYFSRHHQFDALFPIPVQYIVLTSIVPLVVQVAFHGLALHNLVVALICWLLVLIILIHRLGARWSLALFIPLFEALPLVLVFEEPFLTVRHPSI